MQAHAVLQLAPSGNIAGFYAMRSHVGSQACILEKRKKDILLCCDELSSKVRGQQADLSSSQLKNASYSSKYIINVTISYFLIVEFMY